jgi:hypothetical protein
LPASIAVGRRSACRDFQPVPTIHRHLADCDPDAFDFWRNVQALYHGAHQSVDPTATLPAEMSAIDARFKAMLALTAAQPEGLAPREIAFLAEYLETHTPTVTRIDINRPEESRRLVLARRQSRPAARAPRPPPAIQRPSVSISVRRTCGAGGTTTSTN